VDLRLECHGRDGALWLSHGVTEDLSRRGLRFRSEEPLEIGAEVVTRIAWPVRLQNVCELELIVTGRVTRVSDRGTILSIRSYEFRTCGSRSFDQAPPLSSNWTLA
jgi:PilZ domain-containing protein